MPQTAWQLLIQTSANFCRDWQMSPVPHASQEPIEQLQTANIIRDELPCVYVLGILLNDDLGIENPALYW